MESSVYQDLIDRLNRIEQYVERTTHLLQDIDDELEMSTKDLIDPWMFQNQPYTVGVKRILFASAIRRVEMFVTSISHYSSALDAIVYAYRVCAMTNCWSAYFATRIN